VVDVTNSFSTPSDSGPPGDAFGRRWSPRPVSPTGGRPAAWLVAAAVVAITALVLALGPLVRPDVFPFAFVFVAWVLAGPVAIVMLAAFMAADAQAQAQAGVLCEPPVGRRVGYWIVLGTVVVGIVLSAWHIATFVGRQ
jgi:hypothetical protein